jgi:MinD-like ATPase involved in chromosome partitioning or flagellar assembly
MEILVPVISVIGTKGGVGKSTVSIGVAAWLSKLQDDMVLLVDGDPHVKTAELKLCRGVDVTLADVMRGKYSLADAIYLCQLKLGKSPIFPKLALLPVGGRFFPNIGRDMPKFVKQSIDQLKKMMALLRKNFSYVIVDTPASVTFEHVILTAIADGLIYVVTPDVDSIFSTRQTAAGLKEIVGTKGVGVVMNRVPRGTIMTNWMDYARYIAPMLGSIDDDDLIEDAFRQNLPVVVAYPRIAASLSLRDIAKAILKIDIKPAKLAPRLEMLLRPKFVAEKPPKSKQFED